MGKIERMFQQCIRESFDLRPKGYALVPKMGGTYDK